MSEPIPAPPGLPIIGNAWDIDPQDSSLSFQHLAETYGRFYKLRLGGKDIYIVGNYEIYNEICDEKRFTKGLVVGCTSSEMPYMTDYSRYIGEDMPGLWPTVSSCQSLVHFVFAACSMRCTKFRRNSS